MSYRIRFQVRSVLLRNCSGHLRRAQPLQGTSVVLKGSSPCHCFPQGLLPFFSPVLLLKSSNVGPACQFPGVVFSTACVVVVREGGARFRSQLNCMMVIITACHVRLKSWSRLVPVLMSRCIGRSQGLALVHSQLPLRAPRAVPVHPFEVTPFFL